MARFLLNVNHVVSVDVDGAFLAEHAGNHDAIMDEIASLYFAGDCETVDDSIIDAVEEFSSGSFSDSPISFV